MTTTTEEYINETGQPCICPICWEFATEGEMCAACTYLGCTDKRAACA